MRRNTFCTIIFIFVLSISFTDIARARPDSHAPIGVMGEHGHKAGEMMLAYRFMSMEMRGLQSGTDTVETADVLNVFEKSFESTESGRHCDDSPDGLWWFCLCFRF